MTAPAQNGFIGRLESLRGLAALMVALYHSVAAIPPTAPTIDRVLPMICACLNGHAAVTLFFVLSGFVLRRALEKDSAPFAIHLARYSIRRLLRIYPAYFFSSLALLGYYAIAGAGQGSPLLVEMSAHGPITFAYAIRNLLFVSNDLNPVTWTLRVELIASLALPFLHIVVTPISGRGRLLLLAALTVISLQFSLAGVGTYFVMFYLGHQIPDLGPRLLSPLSSRPITSRLLLLFACALLVRARYLHAGGVAIGAAGILLEGAAAWWIVAALLYGPSLTEYRLLDRASLRWLGRVSFSFYLVHLVVLLGVTRILIAHAPRSLLEGSASNIGALQALSSITIALLLAGLLYDAVERPGIALGKRIAERIGSAGWVGNAPAIDADSRR